MTTEQPATGDWYADPMNPGFQRYRDDLGWTDQTRPDPGQYPAGAQPPSYLGWAIVVTLLGFWPLGVPAILNASKVDGAWLRGNYAEAMARSRAAKRWTIAAAASSVLLFGVVLLMGIAVVMAGTPAS